jgi:hypothetical protein
MLLRNTICSLILIAFMWGFHAALIAFKNAVEFPTFIAGGLLLIVGIVSCGYLYDYVNRDSGGG